MNRHQWHPASGYRTESGKGKWRVLRERTDAERNVGLGLGSIEELCGVHGRCRLFGSYESARRVADALNG